MRQYQKQTGFTIVELLIVVVVIAILAAISIVSYNGITDRAKESAVQSAAGQGLKKVMTHSTLNGDQYPVDLAATGLSTSSGVTYQYMSDNNASPRTYCLTATQRSISYYVSNLTSNPVKGLCPGHNGMALSCPTGYAMVPGNSLFSTLDFCVMKYEAKNVGGLATSQAAGTPWVSISQTSAASTASAACSGCRLISDNEWLTIAHNALSVPSNWTSGVVGTGAIFFGHNDNVPTGSLAASSDDTDGYNGTTDTSPSGQRRTLTLTNGQVIWDFAGNVYEWTTAIVPANQQPGLSGDVAYTWKQWNSGSLIMNSYPASALPSHGTAAASGWTSTRGLGQLFSNYTETTTDRGVLRGGSWNNNSLAGVFSLNMSSAPSYTGSSAGFRVSQ